MVFPLPLLTLLFFSIYALFLLILFQNYESFICALLSVQCIAVSNNNDESCFRRIEASFVHYLNYQIGNNSFLPLSLILVDFSTIILILCFNLYYESVYAHQLPTFFSYILPIARLHYLYASLVCCFFIPRYTIYINFFFVFSYFQIVYYYHYSIGIMNRTFKDGLDDDDHHHDHNNHVGNRVYLFFFCFIFTSI